MTIPRIARVPHTSKDPERCPYCGGHNLTRRGQRKKKLEIVQLWRCAACKRQFTPNPEALRNKTYPLRMVLGALEDYCLGYPMAETAARLRKKTNRTVSPNTISNWLGEYKNHCSYLRIRDHAKTRFPAAQTIRTVKLYHRQIYAFAFHRAKLEMLRDGTLDDKRANSETSTKRFAPLANFLEAIPVICPHDLFTIKDVKARASQATPAFADPSRTIVTRKQNAATEAAAFIIPAVGNNKLRHESLQQFMLACDSVTVAIEIPIWLDEADISALEREHGIELAPRDGNKPRSITGHIDFLQVRNGAVHILDYKPDARTNTPIAQLAIYALALTRRVPGLKLFDIKCAWFNEHEYDEFFSRTLFARR